MKLFNELTPEEIKNIICNTNFNPPVFYSKLTSFDTEAQTITYNSETLHVPNPTTFNKVVEGKITYESYVLQMSQSEAKNILSDASNEALEQKLTNKIEEVLVPLKSLYTDLHSQFLDATTHLDATVELINNAKNISNKLSTSYESLNTTKLQKDMDEKVKELREVKTTIEKELDPIKKAFTGVVKNLESLFDK